MWTTTEYNLPTRVNEIQYTHTERSAELSYPTSPGTSRVVGHVVRAKYRSGESALLNLFLFCNEKLLATLTKSKLSLYLLELCGRLLPTNQQLVSNTEALSAAIKISQPESTLARYMVTLTDSCRCKPSPTAVDVEAEEVQCEKVYEIL